MARRVTFEQSGPIKIDPATWPRDAAGNLKNIWVCGCGLSRTFPLCDQTHKCCKDEQPGVLYEYLGGERVEVRTLAKPAVPDATELPPI